MGLQGVAAVHVAQLFLLHDLEDDLLAGVGRVGQAREGINNRGPHALIGLPGGQGRVDIDLRGAAGKTGFAQVGKGCTAVAGGISTAGRERDTVGGGIKQHLAGIDRIPLRGKAVVRTGKDGGSGHVGSGKGQVGIRLVIGAADVTLADAYQSVRGAVAFQVVIVGVGSAVHIGGRYQRHELVRELVCHRVANEGQVCVRLEGAQDVVEHRIREHLLKVPSLLHVSLLIDDAGFQRGEISRDVGGEIIGNVFLQPVFARAASRERIAGCGFAGGDDALDRGEIQFERGEVRRQGHQLDIEAGGLPGARADQAHPRPSA